MAAKVLVIACGAIAPELVRIRDMNGWDHVEFQCLPPELHNTPAKIPGAVLEKIRTQADSYTKVFVAYADCGTGGLLDEALRDLGIERIPGAHCYEFFAGSERFFEFHDEEPGTFYLTDFLVRHFDRFVRKTLGLDRHPQLRDMYFGNYKRVVYLVQIPSEKLSAMAREQAAYLGLEYEEHFTGLGPVDGILQEQEITWRN